jgi:hypothetical protein
VGFSLSEGILAVARDSRCRKGFSLSQGWDSPWDSRCPQGLTTNWGLATIDNEMGINDELWIHDELGIDDDLEKIGEDPRVQDRVI